MKKQVLFIILLLFINFQFKSSFSQTNIIFTADSLISELKSFYQLNEANLLKNRPAFIKDSVINELGAIWEEQIKREDKIQITKILNYQISKRFDKDKTIFYFLNSICKFKQKDNTNFSPWLSMLKYMESSPYVTSTGIEKLITDIFKLLNENYLSITSTTRWKLSDGIYKLRFDPKLNKLFVLITNGSIESYSLDNDTIKILNTKGSYDVEESFWIGENGNITWEKFGISASKVNVKLSKYSINMRKTEFTADSVTFTNKDILDYQILGKIEHSASKRGASNGLFPDFRSYRNDYEIKSNQKNISFISGIQMKGPTLKFVGTDSIPAVAEYRINGVKYLRAQSNDFSSFENKLKSYQSAVTLYIAENDSITHPNVFLELAGNNFMITRNPKGTGNRPFYNSYQMMYIEVDNISLNTEDTLIRFYSRQGAVSSFKSFDYFTKEDFTKHQMYETQNPLFDIKNYTKKIKSRSFYAEEYAAYVKQNVTGVIHRLMGLWYEGFLDYNPNTKLVIVRQKLYDYIEYFFDRKDYDVINILSKGVLRKQDADLFPLENAVYNIKTKQMTVFGTDQVVINQRKKVGFIPENNTFIIDKNRNMYFSGRLRVGLADFYGSNFVFNYDDYDFKFTDGDSLVYRVWEKDLSETGEKEKSKFLNSTIEHISGIVRIDVKTNKSGAKEIHQFPKFTSTDTSYVYYDKRNKQGLVYTRDNFYFRNDIFEHDSLLYLTKDHLKIPGMMFAGIIFPKFRDTLEVQNDYSLGFIHRTADDGLKLFGGKVSLSAENNSMQSYIKLSNEGLEANGIAKWNNTTITTRDFTLYPDSLTALADEIEISEFINEETYAEFPYVKGKLVNTRWDAVNDVVRYKTTGIPVEMYEGEVQFSGMFEYRPKSLTGKGDAVVKEGTVTADDFLFNKQSFFSNKADLVIREDKSKNQEVIVKNMKTFVDINAKKATFQKIEGEKSSVNFVSNEYLSFPDHLLWHTGEGKINMNYNMNIYTDRMYSKEEILMDSVHLMDVCKFDKSLFAPAYGDLRFVSTNKDQDSLMFFGSRANYSTENKKLITKDVMRIIVADIVVTPNSDVVVDVNGEMEKLLKTTVRARGKHLINDVDIKINSSNSYVASSGIYQYEDMNKNMQNINFDNITYDQSKRASVAHGFIEQFQNFTLNPWFEYYGDVNFNATKDQLRFEGYAKLVHTCSSKPNWFYFKSDINPDSIYLPLEPRLHSDIQINKARIFADIMSSKDSIHTFPVFLSTDPYGTSESVLSLRDSSYYVTYSQDNNRYEITTLAKFKDKSLPGNYLDMSRSFCIVNGEGKINFTNSLRVNDIGAYGNIRFDTNSGEVLLQTLTYIDFFFNNKSLNILKDKLVTNLSLPAVKLSENSYKKPMYEMLGKVKADNMFLEMSENLGKPRKFPPELNKTIVFTNTNFKWDHPSKSYKSIGKIGISNIGDQMINKYVNGYIQILKRRTGDKVFIYLEISDKEWFFFTFSGGIMRTISSDHEYNLAIENIKTKDKRITTDKGIFNYMMTNSETKNIFIYSFTGEHPAIDEFDDVDSGDENN